MEKEQKWFCELCNREGTVFYEADADVMTVVMEIGDDHKKVSPACPQPPDLIRIVNPHYQGAAN